MSPVLQTALQSLQHTPVLWPHFKPQHTPLLLFDGQQTWLTGATPQEAFWQQTDQGWLWPGRHPALIANSVIELPEGIQAAGVLLHTLGDIDHIKAPQLAALLIHEAFHVYQKAHPSIAWQVNELAALTYPNANAQILHSRAEETEYLAQALADQSNWKTHAQQAFYWRKQRRMLLRPEHNEFEQRMETLEGLAEFVETRFLNAVPKLEAKTAIQQPPRQWAYSSGAALAHLLLHTGNDWQRPVLDGQTLEDLLEAKIGTINTPPIHRELQTLAQITAQQHQEKQQQSEQQFFLLEGTRLHLASQQPLQITGFDPMNIQALDQQRILHNRFISIQGPDISIELFNHPALASGPSLMKITELEIPQLPEPTLQDGIWCIQTDAFKIKLPAHSVQRNELGWNAFLE